MSGAEKILTDAIEAVVSDKAKIDAYNRKWRQEHQGEGLLAFNKYVPLPIEVVDGKKTDTIAYVNLYDYLSKMNFPLKEWTEQFQPDAGDDEITKSVNAEMRKILWGDSSEVSLENQARTIKFYLENVVESYEQHPTTDEALLARAILLLNRDPPEWVHKTYSEEVYHLSDRIKDTSPNGILTYISTPQYIKNLKQRNNLSGTARGDTQEKRQAIGNLLEAEIQIIQWVLDPKKETLDINDIKTINRLTCTGLKNNKGSPGEFRDRAIYVTGSPEYEYIPTKFVEKEMNIFCLWLNEEMKLCKAKGIHPIGLAALAYQRLVSIHPFFDGNGRTGRMVMDFILQKFGLPPSAMETCQVAVFARLSDDDNPLQREIFDKVVRGVEISCETLDIDIPEAISIVPTEAEEKELPEAPTPRSYAQRVPSTLSKEPLAPSPPHTPLSLQLDLTDKTPPPSPPDSPREGLFAIEEESEAEASFEDRLASLSDNLFTISSSPPTTPSPTVSPRDGSPDLKKESEIKAAVFEKPVTPRDDLFTVGDLEPDRPVTPLENEEQ